MGINYNPGIVTSGLITYLDAANKKSYNYSENLVLATNSIGDVTNYSNAGPAGLTLNAAIAPDGSNTATLIDNTASANFYIFAGSPQSLNANTIYTYSIHVKQGNTTNFQITIDEASFGGKRYYAIFTYSTQSITTGVTGLTAQDGYVVGSTVTALPNSWYRIALTFRTSSTNVSGFVDMIARFSNPGQHYVWGRQLEYGSVMNAYTPITTTIITRSNLFKDLSGNQNNAVLASSNNSPTFSLINSGCFILENENSGIVLSNNINYDNLIASKNFTIIIGAQKQYYGTGGNNFGDSMLLLGSISGYLQGWRIIEYSSGTAGSIFNGTSKYTFGANNSINVVDNAANRFSIVGFSQSSNTVVGFLNNNIVTAAFNSSHNPGTTYGGMGYANYGVGSFKGLISFILIYNRTLSIAEIQQNYNALRGRYGL